MEMTISQLLIGCIILAFTFIMGKFYKGFKAYTNAFIEGNENQKINESISIVQDTVNSVVVYLNTTTVNSIKEASADGKLTKEEATEVFNEAKKEIKKIIKGDTLSLVSKVIGDVDSWLDILIEQFVQENK